MAEPLAKFSPCIIVRSRAGKHASKDLRKIRQVATECFEMLLAGRAAKTVAVYAVQKLRLKINLSCETDSMNPDAYRSVVMPAYRRAAAVVADVHGDFCAANTSRKTFGGPPNNFALGVLHNEQLGAVSVAGENGMIQRYSLPSAILNTQDNAAICAFLRGTAATADCPLAAIFIDKHRVPHIFTPNTDMIWAYVTGEKTKFGFEQGKCLDGYAEEAEDVECKVKQQY